MNTNDNPNAMECGSQTSRILDWLRKGNSIDAIRALNIFGCFRLAARIADITRMGYKIKSSWRLTPGKNKRHKEYSLEYEDTEADRSLA